MKKIEKPVVVKVENSPVSELKTTHPAFGMIGASRFSGGDGIQFASGFRHHGGITIRVSHAEENRSTSRNWQFARGSIVEVTLTEAQWATFVSSLNCGSGVPCTIESIQGQEVPAIDASYLDDGRKASRIDLQNVMADIVNRLRAEVELATTQKQRHRLAVIADKAESNFKFVAEQFDRHAEDTVEAAKQEIEGYMMGRFVSLGIESAKTITGKERRDILREAY